jgi:hypothetical protein
VEFIRFFFTNQVNCPGFYLGGSSIDQ